MKEIENFIKSVEKVQEIKTIAAKFQHFELSATLRDFEKKLLIQIAELTIENEKFLKYAGAHLETPI